MKGTRFWAFIASVVLAIGLGVVGGAPAFADDTASTTPAVTATADPSAASQATDDGKDNTSKAAPAEEKKTEPTPTVTATHTPAAPKATEKTKAKASQPAPKASKKATKSSSNPASKPVKKATKAKAKVAAAKKTTETSSSSKSSDTKVQATSTGQATLVCTKGDTVIAFILQAQDDRFNNGATGSWPVTLNGVVVGHSSNGPGSTRTFTVSGVIPSGSTVTVSGIPTSVTVEGGVTLEVMSITCKSTAPIVTAAPTKPVQTVVDGQDNDKVVPPEITGVKYTCSDWVDGTMTCTASAEQGYVLPEGSTTQWTFTDENTGPSCVTLTDKNVAKYGSLTWSRTAATVVLKKGDYCNDWTFSQVGWTLNNAPSTWPQTAAVVASAKVGKSGLSASATIRMLTCGQVDGYVGSGPAVGDKLSGPNQGYEASHPKLSQVFGGTPTVYLDTSGCSTTPPKYVHVGGPITACTLDASKIDGELVVKFTAASGELDASDLKVTGVNGEKSATLEKGEDGNFHARLDFVPTSFKGLRATKGAEVSGEVIDGLDCTTPPPVIHKWTGSLGKLVCDNKAGYVPVSVENDKSSTENLVAQLVVDGKPFGDAVTVKPGSYVDGAVPLKDGKHTVDIVDQYGKSLVSGPVTVTANCAPAPTPPHHPKPPVIAPVVRVTPPKQEHPAKVVETESATPVASQQTLAYTGADGVNAMLTWGSGLVGGGFLCMVLSSVRRRRRQNG